jgi:hypothetical protein
MLRFKKFSMLLLSLLNCFEVIKEGSCAAASILYKKVQAKIRAYLRIKFAAKRFMRVQR